jgi:hypothetical protein
MLDPSARDEFVELARARLAAGSPYDDVLDWLRQSGLEKFDSILIIEETGMPYGEAKLLVHDSPVWADRRESDDRLEEQLWRALFVLSLNSGGHVDDPPEWAAECAERQRLAGAQLRAVAAGLPDADLGPYHECMTHGQVGDAFAALVTVAGRQPGVPDGCWHALAEVAETLCLAELLTEDEPAIDEADYIYAAHVVRRRVRG